MNQSKKVTELELGEIAYFPKIQTEDGSSESFVFWGDDDILRCYSNGHTWSCYNEPTDEDATIVDEIITIEELINKLKAV